MGAPRSFRIEAKRFDIALEDGRPVQVKITESGKRQVCSVHMSKDGAWWVAKGVEENIVREGDPSFLRTYRENDQGLVICRHGNDKGRFVELMVYGKGGVKGRLVIPEGKKQGGWRGFSAELRHLLEPRQQPINVKGVLPTPASRNETNDGQNHRHGGHQTWSSVLFPHKETMEKLKQQGRDPRDYRGDNGRESFLGFGAKFTAPILGKNELMLDLKLKLTCNSLGEWKVAWAGLDEEGPCTNLSGPPPAGPMPKLKQVWKPVGPRPSRPVAHNDKIGPHITKPTKPIVNDPYSDINPEVSTSNRFSIFEFGSSSASETQPSTTVSSYGLLQGSSASALQAAPTPVATVPSSTDSPTMELSLSETSSQLGLDGAAKPKADSCSVTLATQDSRPGGTVVHAWGTPQEWFLELKDGQRLRLPVEIEKSVHPEIAEDHLLNWYESCEADSNGDQEEYGTMTVVDSETQDRMDVEGMEVSDDTFDGEMEPIPLAMAQPPLEGGDSVKNILCENHDGCSEISDWVNGRYKAFGKLVGASYEGYEREVIALLISIEARRNQRKPAHTEPRTPKKQGNKGRRELKGLVSSINYDSRAKKVSQDSRDGEILLIQ
jgi:hypothetical protein